MESPKKQQLPDISDNISANCNPIERPSSNQIDLQTYPATETNEIEEQKNNSQDVKQAGDNSKSEAVKKVEINLNQQTNAEVTEQATLDIFMNTPGSFDDAQQKMNESLHMI